MAIYVKGIGTTEKERNLSLLRSTHKSFDNVAYDYATRIGIGDTYTALLSRLDPNKEYDDLKFNSWNDGKTRLWAFLAEVSTDDELKSMASDVDKDGLVPYVEYEKNNDGTIKQIYNPELKNEDGSTGGFEPVKKEIRITARERIKRQVQGMVQEAKAREDLFAAEVTKEMLTPFEKGWHTSWAVLGRAGMGLLDFVNNLSAFAFLPWGGIVEAAKGNVHSFGEFFTRGLQTETFRPFRFCMGGTNDDFEEWLGHYTYLKNVDGTMSSGGEIVLGMADTIGRYIVPMIITWGIGTAVGATGEAAGAAAGATSATVSKLTTDAVSTAVFYSSYFAGGVKEMKDLKDKYNLQISDWGILAKQSIETALEVAIERVLDVPFGASGLEGIVFGRSVGTGISKGILKSNSPAFVRWIGKFALDAFHEALEEGLQEVADGIVSECFNAINSQYKATGSFDWKAIGQSALIGALTSAFGSTIALVKNNIGSYKQVNEYEVFAGTDEKVLRNKDGKILEYVKDKDGNIVKDEKGNPKTKIAKNQDVKIERKKDVTKIKKRQVITEEFAVKDDGTTGRKIYRNEEGKILNKDGTVAEKQDIKTITKDRKQSIFEVMMIDSQLQNVYESLAKVNDMLAGIDFDDVVNKLRNKEMTAAEFKEKMAPYVDVVRLASIEAMVLGNMYGLVGNDGMQRVNTMFKAFADAASNTQAIVDTLDKLKELKPGQKGKITKAYNVLKNSNNAVLSSLSSVLPENYPMMSVMRTVERIKENNIGGDTVVVDGKTITDMRELHNGKSIKFVEETSAKLDDVLSVLNEADVNSLEKLLGSDKLKFTSFVIAEEGTAPVIIDTGKGLVVVCTKEQINKPEAEWSKITLQQTLTESVIANKVPGVNIDVLTELYRKYNPVYCENKTNEELATLVVTSFIFDGQLQKYMTLHGNKDFGNLYRYINTMIANDKSKVYTEQAAKNYAKGIRDNLLNTYLSFCKNNPFVQVDLSFVPLIDRARYYGEIEKVRKSFNEIGLHQEGASKSYVDALINTVTDEKHRKYLQKLCNANYDANHPENYNWYLYEYITKSVLFTKRKEYMYNGEYRAEFTDGDIIFNAFLKSKNITLKSIYVDGKVSKDIQKDFNDYTKGKYAIKENGQNDCFIVQTDIGYVNAKDIGLNRKINYGKYEYEGKYIISGISNDYSLKEYVKKFTDVNYANVTIDDVIHNPDILDDTVIADILKYSNKRTSNELNVIDIVGYFNEIFIKDNRLICKSLSNEYVVVDYTNLSSYESIFYKNIEKKLFNKTVYDEVEKNHNYAINFKLDEIFGKNIYNLTPTKELTIRVDEKSADYSGLTEGADVYIALSYNDFVEIYKMLHDQSYDPLMYPVSESFVKAYKGLFCTLCHEMVHIGQNYNLLYSGGAPEVFPIEMVKAYNQKYLQSKNAKFIGKNSMLNTRYSMYYFLSGEAYAYGNTSKPYLIANMIYTDGEYFYSPIGRFKAKTTVISKGSIKQQLVENNLLSKDGKKILKSFEIQKTNMQSTVINTSVGNFKDIYNLEEKTWPPVVVTENDDINHILSEYFAKPLCQTARGGLNIAIRYTDNTGKIQSFNMDLNSDLISEYTQMNDVMYSDVTPTFISKRITDNFNDTIDEQSDKIQYDYRRTKAQKKRKNAETQAKILNTKLKNALNKTYTEEEIAKAKQKLESLKNAGPLIKEAISLKKENERLQNTINEFNKEFYELQEKQKLKTLSKTKKDEILSKMLELSKSTKTAKDKIDENNKRIKEIRETKLSSDSKTTIGYYLSKPDAVAALKTTIRNTSVITGEYNPEEDTELKKAQSLIALTRNRKRMYREWDSLGFGKKRKLSQREVKGTNLEYFVKKGRPIQVSTKIQNFIVGADLNKLDSRLADKIKNGTLTYFDILEVIANNSFEPIDDYTFDAIITAIPDFRNPFIRSSKDLAWLVDNLPQVWAAAVMNKDKKRASMITNIKSLQNLIEKLNDKSNPEHESFIQILKAFGLFKNEYVIVRPQDASKRLLKMYNGSLESAADIALSLVYTAAGQEGMLPRQQGTYNKAGEITASTSLDTEIGEGNKTNLSDMIADEDSMRAFAAIDDTPMSEKRLFLLKQEAEAFNYSNEKVTSQAQTKMQDKINAMTDEEVNVAYAKFKLLEEQGIDTTPLTIDNITITKVKSERTSENVVKNIQKKWNSIKTSLEKLSKPLLNRIIRENADFIAQDGTLMEDILYSNVDGKKVFDKPVSELEIIERKLTDLKHDLREKLYENVEQLEIVKQQRKQLRELQAALTREQARNSRKNDFVEHVENTKILNSGFKYTATGDTAMPETLKTILETSFGKTVATKVKDISTDDDAHLQANYKAFFKANAETLSNLSTADVNDIINFYTNISGDTFDNEATQSRYTWVKLVLFQYFVDEARNGTYDITEEQLNNMRAIAQSTFSQAGQILQLKKQVKFSFDPITEITKEVIANSGIVVDADKVENLVAAANDVLHASKSIRATINYQHEFEVAMVRLQREYDALYKDAVEKNKQIGKRNILERLQGLQRLCMLSSLGTMVRNATSNVILRYGNRLADKIGGWLAKTKFGQKFIDKAKSLSFQYRFDGAASADAIKVANSSFMEQLYTMISDGLLKQDVGHIGKNTELRNIVNMMKDSIRTKVFHENEANNKFTKVWQEIVQKGMSDDKFVKGEFKRYLGLFLTQRWGELLANKKTYITETVDNTFQQVGSISKVFEEIIVDAYTQAANDFQHQPNFILKMEQAIKTYGGQAAYFAYKQIIPFGASSWNWFKESLKWTPLGLAKAIKDMITIESKINSMNKYAAAYHGGVVDGRFAVATVLRNISKGAIGTALTLLGALLAIAGFARIDRDDYDKLKLKVGNLYIDVTNVTGSSGLLFGMALFSKDDQDGVLKHTMRAFSLMFDDMLLNQLQSNLQNYKSDNWISAFFTNETRMFYPAVLRDVAKVTNPYKPAYSNAWYRVFEKWLANVPALNWALAAEVDPYTGEKKLTYNVPVLIELINRLSPIKVASYVISDNEREALALGIRKGQIKMDGLNAKQTKELNSIYGAMNNKNLSDLFNGKVSYKVDGKKLRYNQMTSEQKENVIKRIMSNNASYAKVSYLTSQGYKYYATDDEFEALRKLGIRNVYRKTKKLSGFVKD